MSNGFPGGLDTYVTTLDLSGRLMVGFSRNLKKYPVGRYTTITPVKQVRGAYLYFDPLGNARLQNFPNQTRWSPGTRRPASQANTRPFEEKTFTCVRHNFGVELDQLGIDLANWPILERESEAIANDAMVARSRRVTEKLVTTSLYPAANVTTATALAGGFLHEGNTADPRIFTALTEADRLIQVATGGRVKPGELSVLMNHNTAIRLSRSREIREYVMQQEQAQKQITLEKDSFNGSFYLPDVLYRHNVVVEDILNNVGNRESSNDVFVPIFPDNAMLVFMKPGDADGTEGEATFSTHVQFLYEDMKVEVWPDTKHRNTEITITDHTAEEVVAPVTGVFIDNVFS